MDEWLLNASGRIGRYPHGVFELKERIASRMKRIDPIAARVMFEKARAMERKGEELVHFELGEPDFDTPKNIVNAAKRALEEGHTHYTPNSGLLELREAISRKLKMDNQIEADPRSEICVTVGAQEGAFLAVFSTIEPGDEVIVTDPGYFTHPNYVRMAGGTVVTLPVREEDGFRINPDLLEEKMTEKTKMITLNSPANPTGSVLTRDNLESIRAAVEKHDVLVLSDEIYEKMIYDGNKHYSIGAFPSIRDRVITINGFSKSYAMTGWRVGYLVAHKQMLAEMIKLHQNLVTCASSFAQMGAIEALDGSQESVRSMVKEFDKRREIIVAGLNRIDGASCIRPGGAFYVFLNVGKLGKSSWEIADYLLEECKVVTTPGSGFGKCGEGYLRLSYATSIDQIEEGVGRIQSGLERPMKRVRNG
jgi:aspartate/methionine/tyrosine aminotransferase